MLPNSIGPHVQLMCTVVIYLPQEAWEPVTQALISTTPHSISLLFFPFCFFKISSYEPTKTKNNPHVHLQINGYRKSGIFLKWNIIQS